jgi:hypothetical protein
LDTVTTQPFSAAPLEPGVAMTARGSKPSMTGCLPHVDGSPLNSATVSGTFERLAAEAQLSPLTLHGLQHSFATLALPNGVPSKVVSEGGLEHPRRPQVGHGDRRAERVGLTGLRSRHAGQGGRGATSVLVR